MTSIFASMMVFWATAFGPQAPVQPPAAIGPNALHAPAAHAKQVEDLAGSPQPVRRQLDPAHGILWDDQKMLERVSRIA